MILGQAEKLKDTPVQTVIMFRATAILAIIACAAAFAPSARVSRFAPSALKMAFESETGAQAPLGFWDPLGASLLCVYVFDSCSYSGFAAFLDCIVLLEHFPPNDGA